MSSLAVFPLPASRTVTITSWSPDRATSCAPRRADVSGFYGWL